MYVGEGGGGLQHVPRTPLLTLLGERIRRRVRDNTLVELGVRLEDRPDGTSVWKLEDAETLRQEAAVKAATAAAARHKKLQAQLALKTTELAKLEKLAALPPIQDTPAIKEKYSRWDCQSKEAHTPRQGAFFGF